MLPMKQKYNIRYLTDWANATGNDLENYKIGQDLELDKLKYQHLD